ncbi:hypothetical protein J2784_006226 [Paraburkholderia terricola]|nr:hypothetical protein [Paraburkholderia terricola]
MKKESQKPGSGAHELAQFVELGDQFETEDKCQHRGRAGMAFDPSQRLSRVTRSNGAPCHDISNRDADGGAREDIGRIVIAQISTRKANEDGGVQERKHADSAPDNENAGRDGHPQHGVIARKRTPRRQHGVLLRGEWKVQMKVGVLDRTYPEWQQISEKPSHGERQQTAHDRRNDHFALPLAMLAGSKPYPPQNGYEHETLEHIQIGDGFYCMVNQKAEARPGKPRLDDRIKVVHVLVGSMEQREQDDGAGNRPPSLDNQTTSGVVALQSMHSLL